MIITSSGRSSRQDDTEQFEIVLIIPPVGNQKNWILLHHVERRVGTREYFFVYHLSGNQRSQAIDRRNIMQCASLYRRLPQPYHWIFPGQAVYFGPDSGIWLARQENPVNDSAKLQLAASLVACHNLKMGDL